MNYAITNEMLRGLILEMPSATFDSHALIFRAMQQYPQQYTMDLYSFVASPDPILSLHASIGQRLLGIDAIEPTQKIKTHNVRGEKTENQEWSRK